MALSASLASGPLPVAAAAQELWQALHAPALLRWQVPLTGGLCAALTAQVAPAAWPLRVQLEVSREAEGERVEIQVPSNVSPQQLTELLTASCALTGPFRALVQLMSGQVRPAKGPKGPGRARKSLWRSSQSVRSGRSLNCSP